MEDFGLLVGRHFTALPTLSNEQLSELQLDSLGRLIISGRWLAGTDSWSTGDAGVSALAVRNDAGGPLAGIADGEYTPLQVDSLGRLVVNAQVTLDVGAEKAEDSAHVSGDSGNYVLAVRADARPTNANTSLDGDYASLFVNANGELYVHDTDTLAALVTIDAVLDTIKIDTGNIDTSLNNIETDIGNLTHVEDTAHTTGDSGIMSLAVQQAADGALAGEGDYAPLQVDANGRLKTSAVVAISGSEAYIVTDALAAGGDGLETITAAATPWVTVASLALGAGTSARVYGYQWSCDQNAQVRLVTNDTVNTVYYKTDVNSSAQPGKSEHFSEGGRIEIAGAANLEIRLQIKKRSATGGNANGTGSVHIRTI